MKVKLTDKELVHLGWDDPGILRGDPRLAAIVGRIRRGEDLTPLEASTVAEELNLVAADACDDAAVGKRLLKKRDKIWDALGVTNRS